MIYDSTFTQLISVIKFAGVLGWQYQTEQHSFSKYFKECGVLYCKFEDMQKFHNGTTIVVYQNQVYPAPKMTSNTLVSKLLSVNTEHYDAATDSKIVKHSKLQYSKKCGKFITQSNLIEFY